MALLLEADGEVREGLPGSTLGYDYYGVVDNAWSERVLYKGDRNSLQVAEQTKSAPQF